MSIFGRRATSAYDKLDPNQFGEGIENQDIPVFKFETIAKATGNFSNLNRLGQGGFGAVYKVPSLKDNNSWKLMSYVNFPIR